MSRTNSGTADADAQFSRVIVGRVATVQVQVAPIPRDGVMLVYSQDHVCVSNPLIFPVYFCKDHDHPLCHLTRT